MPESPWSIERWRLVGLISTILFAGIVSGYWIPAIIIPTAIYIGWMLYQLKQLETWVNLNANKKNAPTGNGAWASIVQSIYRIRRKERKRKRRLAEIVNRFQATASALPYATIILSQNNEIEWVNPAAAKLLGINRNHDQGQRIDNLIRNPQFQEFLNQSIDEINDLGDESEHAQLEIPSPNNPDITLLLRRVPFNKNQSLITARNISKTIALQRMRKTFIANASHELRTPLTVILGYLETLLKTAPPSETTTKNEQEGAAQLPKSFYKALKVSHNQAQHMQRILDDLLTLSRLESSATLSETLPTAQSVAKIAQNIANDIHDTDTLEQHHLHLKTDPNIEICGKPNDIHSLINNLVMNAIRHTPRETNITVIWQGTPDAGAELIVSDNGTGIEPQHITRLTERFYRTDAARSRNTGGTGLGLAIVEQIAQGLDSQLNIQSSPGNGAKFTITVPAHRLSHLTPKSDAIK